MLSLDSIFVGVTMHFYSLISFYIFLLCRTSALAPPSNYKKSSITRGKESLTLLESKVHGASLLKHRHHVDTTAARILSFGTTIVSSIAFANAAHAYDDLELAELPPPYIPVAFGIVLLVGVGLLTSSLGDIMTEESLLGLQSGAKAKKEMERSRSSYFKKK
jgi:hypothetical protein